MLIYPSSGESGKSTFSPPHSLLSIASPLVDEFNVKIIDQRVDPDWKAKLKSYVSTQPAAIAFSAMTGLQIRYALDTAKLIREQAGNTIPLIWGGVHASMLAEQTLENEHVDIIVRGEGDISFKEIVKRRREGKSINDIPGISFKEYGKKIHNPDSKLLNLNEIGEIPWQLIDVENYINDGNLMFEPGTVKRMLDLGVTSKGCPHKCSFCYNLFFNKMYWRGMSAEKTFERFKQAVDDFDLDGIWVHDDNYFVDPKRVENVADMMIKDNMDVQWTSSGITVFTYAKMQDELKDKIVKSGCSSFRFGIESASPRILEMIDKPNTVEQVYDVNKDTLKHNISPIYSFMIGFPTETREEILETCKLAVKVKRENPHCKTHGISVYTPYPGTPLYDLAVKHGFNPPKSFEAWSNIYWGSKDVEISLCEVEREYLDNVQDISYLNSDWFNYIIPKWMSILGKPARMWFNYRWQHQMFNSSFELDLYRKMRRFMYS
ncbi:B12-binding domain-containing radical SAM protein [Candidatus Woesearchaeota archaeon]|nr:B12-binding domain-containing radical SAM protein [Candidatus Woesearchaeota archaeon]